MTSSICVCNNISPGCHDVINLYLMIFSQVAVLCQFTEDVDYGAAFRALQERHTYDAMDSYYVCIWDVSILEYLVRILTSVMACLVNSNIIYCQYKLLHKQCGNIISFEKLFDGQTKHA